MFGLGRIVQMILLAISGPSNPVPSFQGQATIVPSQSISIAARFWLQAVTVAGGGLRTPPPHAPQRQRATRSRQWVFENCGASAELEYAAMTSCCSAKPQQMVETSAPPKL